MMFPIILIVVLFPLAGTLGDATDGLVDDRVHAADETAGLGTGDEAAAGGESDEGAAAGRVRGIGVSGGEFTLGTLSERGVWVLRLLFRGRDAFR